jgi:hypothetical protein
MSGKNPRIFADLAFIPDMENPEKDEQVLENALKISRISGPDHSDSGLSAKAKTRIICVSKSYEVWSRQHDTQRTQLSLPVTADIGRWIAASKKLKRNIWQGEKPRNFRKAKDLAAAYPIEDFVRNLEQWIEAGEKLVTQLRERPSPVKPQEIYLLWLALITKICAEDGVRTTAASGRNIPESSAFVSFIYQYQLAMADVPFRANTELSIAKSIQKSRRTYENWSTERLLTAMFNVGVGAEIF